MEHIAIMKKSWNLSKKILSGEKTIESRWYMHKAKPWGIIEIGDKIYFKDSGSPVSVCATVAKLELYENIDDELRTELLKKYNSKELGTLDLKDEINSYVKDKKYALFIYLENPIKIEPFEINKKGFGAMSAWICVEDINKIKISL